MQSIKETFKNITGNLCELYEDVHAALSHPLEIKSHFNQAKMLASSLVLIHGIATIQPYEIIGGAIPVAEALNELEHQGHEYRISHPFEDPAYLKDMNDSVHSFVKSTKAIGDLDFY